MIVLWEIVSQKAQLFVEFAKQRKLASGAFHA